jgi:hypothetical protein
LYVNVKQRAGSTPETARSIGRKKARSSARLSIFMSRELTAKETAAATERARLHQPRGQVADAHDWPARNGVVAKLPATARAQPLKKMLGALDHNGCLSFSRMRS